MPDSETVRPGAAKRDYKETAAVGLRSEIPRALPPRLGDLGIWRNDIREEDQTLLSKITTLCGRSRGPPIAPWHARAPRGCEAVSTVSEARGTMKSLYSPQQTLVTQGCA